MLEIVITIGRNYLLKIFLNEGKGFSASGRGIIN